MGCGDDAVAVVYECGYSQGARRGKRFELIRTEGLMLLSDATRCCHVKVRVKSSP